MQTQAGQGIVLLQNRAGGEKACYANPTRPPPPLQALGLQPFYIHNNMLKTPHSFRIYFIPQQTKNPRISAGYS